MHNKEIKSGDYYSDSKRVVELIINIYESNFVSGESNTITTVELQIT